MRIRAAVKFGFVLLLAALVGEQAEAQERFQTGATALQRYDQSEQADPEAPQAQPSGDITMQNVRAYFEQMSRHRRHPKDRVEIALRNGTRLEGRIVSVGADRFTIRITAARQEISVNFSDLSNWQLTPPDDHIALNLLAAAGLELLEVAKLPLTILATLSGRCGC